MKILISVQILALFITSAFSQNLPQTKPADVGLSSERLERIMTMLRDDSAKGTIPGAVLLVARHGKVAWFETAGVLNPQTKAPMTRDAIFRIYSMSKPITTVAAMTLFEDGKISLSDPLQRYIPAFAHMQVGVEKDGKLEMVPARRPITIQDLMRHTSGLTYGIFGTSLVKKMYNDAKILDGDYTNAEFAERVAKLPLIYQPGTTWEYSHSTDILGRVVEVASGMSLYQYEKQRVLDPLGMNDTGFYVTEPVRQPRIAEPNANDRTIGIGAVMNDPRIAGKWESGGGGMVSTTMDYARFLQMMLNGGTLNGKRILGPRTIAYMTSDQLTDGIVPGPLYIPGPGYGFGLGFAVRRTTGGATDNGSPGDYTWNGVGGTHFWVDPKEDMFVVFMIQSPRQRAHYMTVIRDMVYAAIEK
ncbi:MAG TPA: serine hydrolase domain-containing protein [Bryobacteraceae bacterium]|jgi:CubicO group peptidase (beta-lactamase class C family)|nr:serine hydrolase domain-containing protein [Bryobacteraceae bacterium]